MEERYKILITGPFSSGKTTFIQTLSDTEFVSTEEILSNGSSDGKKYTTVGIDFGKIIISDDLSIYLFGTPGQERFDFIWEDQINGSIAIMIMVDRSDFSSVMGAKNFVKFYTSRTNVPIIIVANKSDLPSVISMEGMKQFFEPIVDCKIVECVGKNKASAKDALYTVFFQVILNEPVP
ncbi:MAG: ATP/GTP-binding protein [Caldisericia bacterium]